MEEGQKVSWDDDDDGVDDGERDEDCEEGW